MHTETEPGDGARGRGRGRAGAGEGADEEVVLEAKWEFGSYVSRRFNRWAVLTSPGVIIVMVVAITIITAMTVTCTQGQLHR